MNGSLWELVASASFVVQVVLVLLLGLSFASWMVIFMRFRAFRGRERILRTFVERFWSGEDLRRIYTEILRDRKNPLVGMMDLFVVGLQEFDRLLEWAGGDDSDAVLQGARRAMRAAMMREEEVLSRQLSLLATVGSISPFVGLFGTVWGIMIALLDVVEVAGFNPVAIIPSLAEALIPTACGLLAAIPAVIAYNRFLSWLDRLMHRYEAFLEEFTSILYRHL